MYNNINYEEIAKEILKTLQLDVGKDVNEHAISQISSLIKDKVTKDSSEDLIARVLRVWRFCIQGSNSETPFEEMNTIETNAWGTLSNEYENTFSKKQTIYKKVEEKFERFKDAVLEREKEGKIVIMTWDGVKEVNIDDVIKQPTEGLLYDLNRDKVTILSYIEDPKWVNDYACMLVIKKLKENPWRSIKDISNYTIKNPILLYTPQREFETDDKIVKGWFDFKENKCYSSELHDEEIVEFTYWREMPEGPEEINLLKENQHE